MYFEAGSRKRLIIKKNHCLPTYQIVRPLKKEISFIKNFFHKCMLTKLKAPIHLQMYDSKYKVVLKSLYCLILSLRHRYTNNTETPSLPLNHNSLN